MKVLDHMGRVSKSRPAPEPQDPPADGQGAEGSTQPARKKRRVSTKSSKAKKTFYGTPSKMNTRAPAS